MTKPLIIAVDGPAASGKGTLAAKLAAHFHLPHLDTGLLYRATAKKTLQLKNVAKPPQKGFQAITTLNYNPTDPYDPDTLWAIEAANHLRHTDLVGDDLGSEPIAQAASIVSAIPDVRKSLIDYQRNFAAQPQGAVLDGRDIGTVICPNATIKFYIIASPAVRAERRFKQQQLLDPKVKYESILADIKARDARDSTRATAPLKPAEDAIHLDTSSLTAEDVFTKALELVNKKIR